MYYAYCSYAIVSYSKAKFSLLQKLYLNFFPRVIDKIFLSASCLDIFGNSLKHPTLVKKCKSASSFSTYCSKSLNDFYTASLISESFD